MEKQIVNQKYQLIEKIGSGAYYEVWKCVDLEIGQEWAIKFEAKSTKHQSSQKEYAMLNYLHSSVSEIQERTPRAIYYGTEGDKNVMVMDLLGKSLDDSFLGSNKMLQLKPVLSYGIQMIELLQALHEKRILHRNLKPSKFITGKDHGETKLYLTGFNFAKKYMTSEGQHLEYKENCSLRGTSRYLSANIHLGKTASRRDDMIAIGYILVELSKGSLPWKNMKAKSIKDKYEQIKDCKVNTSIDELCEGMPKEFAAYLTHCYGLEFEEKPDYDYLKGLFTGLLQEQWYGPATIDVLEDE